MDEPRLQNIRDAIEAVQRVLENCNDELDRQEKEQVVEVLKTEVEDWKGHRVEAFGPLLLHGKYTVLKHGDVSRESAEREVRAEQTWATLFRKGYADMSAVSHVPFRENPPLLQGNQS